MPRNTHPLRLSAGDGLRAALLGATKKPLALGGIPACAQRPTWSFRAKEPVRYVAIYRQLVAFDGSIQASDAFEELRWTVVEPLAVLVLLEPAIEQVDLVTCTRDANVEQTPGLRRLPWVQQALQDIRGTRAAIPRRLSAPAVAGATRRSVQLGFFAATA